MFKKFVLSAALAFALVGGGVAATAGAPAAASTAVSQAAPVQLASLATPVSADAAALTVTQMGEVRGNSPRWQRFKRWLKKTVKKVIGVIIQEILDTVYEWLEEIFGGEEGGERQESSEVAVRNYDSQADYEADNVSSSYTEHNDWQQTQVWYGSGGGGGGGGCGDTELQTYEQQEEQLCYAN